MIIALDTTGDTPIYVQLRNQIVMGIGRGDLKIGESLPTIRQLAVDAGINMMTVTKAYNILKNEGFIEIDRRHGARVNPRLDASARFREKLESELALLITESSLKGMSCDDFMEMCRSVFQQLNVSYEGGV